MSPNEPLVVLEVHLEARAAGRSRRRSRRASSATRPARRFHSHRPPRRWAAQSGQGRTLTSSVLHAQRWTKSSTIPFSDWRTIRPRAGSPGSAWASALACSKRMCGGSGGTSGSVIASISTVGRRPPAPRPSARRTASGVVDPDPLQPDAVPRSARRESRAASWESSSFGSPDITRCSQVDLVEIVVVEHEHDQLLVCPAIAVARDVDHRVDAEHLERAVADRPRSPDDRDTRTWPRARRESPGHIVASVPDRAVFIPLRSRMCRAHQSVDEPESLVRIAWSGSRLLSSWNSSCGLSGSADSWAPVVEHLPPAAHVVLDLRAPRRGPPGGAAAGSALCSVCRAVADQVDLHRVAHPDAAARRCRSGRRAPGPTPAATPSTGSSTRPSAACRSPPSCRRSASEPSSPIGPVTNGRSSGTAARAVERLGDPGAEQRRRPRSPLARRRSRPARRASPPARPR